MSKSITALAIAILETEGKPSFDDPVFNYFPRFCVPGIARDTVTPARARKSHQRHTAHGAFGMVHRHEQRPPRRRVATRHAAKVRPMP